MGDATVTPMADSTRLRRRTLLAGAAAAAGAAGLTAYRAAGAAATRAPSNLTVTSGNAQLVADFAWARQEALSWVQTGKPGATIPCYWAGLTTRRAFYSRDFAHQTVGAHLLGLDTENLAMLRAFAASATAARKWYPLWSLGFDGRIFPVDYHSDTNFVREIPAVFELTQKGVGLYRWTGDRTYVTDAALFGYYRNSVNAFVSAHDRNHNGIADE